MRREDGFTVVELVIAASILFIVLMGLFGLSTASVALGTKGKQRAVAAAAAGSYIEAIRSVSTDATGYATIGTPGGDPVGTWTATTSEEQGLTVTVTPTITWVDDPELPTTNNYKKITMTVTVSGGGFTDYDYSVTTYVRGPSNSSTSPTGTSFGLPTIAFTSGTPPEGSAISGIVPIGAIAGHEASDGVLTVMRLIGGDYNARSSSGDVAEWGVNAPVFTSTPNPFYWDTMASYEDTATGVVTPYFKDGPVTLVAEALDTRNGRAAVYRSYVIDNSPPDVAPSNFVVNTPTAGATPFILSWAPSSDNGTITSRHRIVVYKQNSADSSMTTWAPTEIVMPTPAGAPTAITYDYTGGAYFSRYAFTVQGVSARWPVSANHNTMASGPAFAGSFTTRPFVSGTASGTASKSHALTVTPPSFPVASTPSISYTWYRKVNAGAWAVLATTATNTYAYTVPDKNDVYQYRVKVTYTPSGPASVPTNIYSQMCGQTNKGNETFANVSDWSQWW